MLMARFEQKSHVTNDAAFSVSHYIDSIKQHLILLLNTASADMEIAFDLFPAARVSVLNYGIPPFSGTYLSSCVWYELEAKLRRAIVLFEPRIMPDSLLIALSETQALGRHNLIQFNIKAALWMPHKPIDFSLAGVLDLENKHISLA